MDELAFYLGFSVFPGIGPARFRLIKDYFGSARRAWQASDQEYTEIGLPRLILESFLEFRKTFSPNEYFELLSKKNIQLLSILDSRYPSLLKEISDAPILLYIYGEGPLSLLSQSRTIGVVGTRAVTYYGKDVTSRLTEGLVRQGFVIVSGMALGVDTIVHQTTLKYGGRTVAVLGCGVDIIAPASNTNLYEQIAETGLVISEMPLGHRPLKGLFPARNRIISGLSRGIVVTEGSESSGSLITARYAAEQGREVFAVPGPITSPYSRGPAKLIRDGATLVENERDIIEALKIEPYTLGKKVLYTNVSSQEAVILKLLEQGPQHIDIVLRETHFNTSELFAILTKLEMDGRVYEVSEQEYGLK